MTGLEDPQAASSAPASVIVPSAVAAVCRLIADPTGLIRRPVDCNFSRPLHPNDHDTRLVRLAHSQMAFFREARVSLGRMVRHRSR